MEMEELELTVEEFNALGQVEEDDKYYDQYTEYILRKWKWFQELLGKPLSQMTDLFNVSYSSFVNLYERQLNN